MPRSIRKIAKASPTIFSRARVASRQPSGRIGAHETSPTVGEDHNKVKIPDHQASGTSIDRDWKGHLLGPNDVSSTTEQEGWERKQHQTERSQISTGRTDTTSDTPETFSQDKSPPIEDADIFNPLRSFRPNFGWKDSFPPTLPPADIALQPKNTWPFSSSTFSRSEPSSDDSSTSWNNVKPRRAENDSTSFSPSKLGGAQGITPFKAVQPTKVKGVTSVKKVQPKRVDSESNNSKGLLSGRKCLITGATSGIGKSPMSHGTNVRKTVVLLIRVYRLCNRQKIPRGRCCKCGHCFPE